MFLKITKAQKIQVEAVNATNPHTKATILEDTDGNFYILESLLSGDAAVSPWEAIALSAEQEEKEPTWKQNE